MRRSIRFRSPVLLLLFLAWGDGACPHARAQEFSVADLDFFEGKIRPLLTKRCFACHRANTELQSELDLGSRESILRGGTRGPAAIPGKKDESLMLQVVGGRHELQMPPDAPLSASEVAFLEEWVLRGLPWPKDVPSRGDRSNSDHWAFQPLQAEPIPSVRQESWPRTSIDYFILADMERAGLLPNHSATPRELIRRVTYDLTGLPPTPAEIDAFLSDRAPNAYEKLVDRLLASPHYGERWARHWLDVVRYADSKDLRDIGGRQDITETYKYRDWVVRALNSDLPYNQFMMNQVAGDLLAISADGKIDPDRIIATGMLAFGVWGPGDSDVEKMHTDMVDDMINVTTRSFLGLTVACARCHDHKFDPITQEDYYALAGIFFSSEIAPPGTSAAWVRIPLVSDSEIEEFNLKESERKKRVSEIAKKTETFRNSAYRSLIAQNAWAMARYVRAAVPALVEAGSLRPEGTLTSEKNAEPTLRADALEQWRPFLELRPRRFAALDQVEENAWKRNSIFRWYTGRDFPFAVLNSS